MALRRLKESIEEEGSYADAHLKEVWGIGLDGITPYVLLQSTPGSERVEVFPMTYGKISNSMIYAVGEEGCDARLVIEQEGLYMELRTGDWGFTFIDGSSGMKYGNEDWTRRKLNIVEFVETFREANIDIWKFLESLGLPENTILLDAGRISSATGEGIIGVLVLDFCGCRNISVAAGRLCAGKWMADAMNKQIVIPGNALEK